MFENLSSRLSNAVRNLVGRGRLTEENIKDALSEVKVALLEADVALPIVTKFVANVQQKAVGQEVLASVRPGEMLVKIVHDELVSVMGTECVPLNLNATPPVVIMLVGLQGSGKTTTTAKLAHYLKETLKKSVLVTSADVYRPAAMEQLKSLATQIGVDYFDPLADSSKPADPVTIAQEAISSAKKSFKDVVLLDTAGRLHIDDTMMQELSQLEAEAHPTETLLVVDSIVGQDAANIAKTFSERLELTGVILTKVDGDARGGAALVMRMVTGKPIKFMGAGEKIDALELFHPERVASRILGMGDILTLVEEAQSKMDQQHAQKIAKKIQKGKAFDLEDFRTQLQQLRKMGGIGNLIGKLPMMGNVQAAAQKIDNRMFIRMEALINSMTLKERCFPATIKGSHKRRIAAGAGAQVQDINQLLRQFEQMQKMLKKMKGGKMARMLQNQQF